MSKQLASDSCTRFITFSGAREDAVERLPSIGKSEQLELGFNRISLVLIHQRVDVFILAELPSALTGTAPLMLLEIVFGQMSAYKAEAFIQSLQRTTKTLH